MPRKIIIESLDILKAMEQLKELTPEKTINDIKREQEESNE